MLFDIFVALVYVGGIWQQYSSMRESEEDQIDSVVTAVFWPINLGTYLAYTALPIEEISPPKDEANDENL